MKVVFVYFHCINEGSLEVNRAQCPVPFFPRLHSMFQYLPTFERHTRPGNWHSIPSNVTWFGWPRLNQLLR